MKSTISPLRIAMFVDAWFPDDGVDSGIFGGGQVHVRELSAQLQKDYDADVCLYFSQKSSLLFRSFWSFGVIWKTIKDHKRNEYSLLHSHGYNCGFSAKIASLLLRIPVIHTVHGSNLIDQRDDSIKGMLESFILTKIRYDAQISVSRRFLQHANVNTNLHVIPNGVRVGVYSRVREEKSENPRVIWVGRQDPVKGIEVLKTAIKKLRKDLPHLEVDLISDGRLSGIDLIRAYKRADVFALSSLAEGQPLTLLEAWAAKLPVVVTDVGDNRDMIEDGVNGYLVQPNNATQLAQALLKVLRSRVNKVRMGEAGYQYVKEHHSWKTIAKRTYAVYKSVL